MYIKLKDGKIDKYPYSLEQLVLDNPNTSFPAIISNECAAEFEVYPVTPAKLPDIDHTKKIVEETPNLIKKVWHQDLTVVDATEEEIASKVQELNELAEKNRASAYRNESDPLFFKWQRGESTEQEWLAKVAEIKRKFPKVL